VGDQKTLAQGLQSISSLNERFDATEQSELKELETHLYLNLASPSAKVILTRNSQKDVAIALMHSYIKDMHPVGGLCLQGALRWFPTEAKEWASWLQYNQPYPIVGAFSSIFDRFYRIEICEDKSCPVG
jgi:hypothetical protein